MCNINPILTYPAYLAGYIEKLGTGTKDLVEDCEAMGLPTPQFVQEEEDFNAIIYRSAVDNVIVNVLETNATLATYFRVNERTIRRDLRVLQEEGFLHHDGPDNDGKWIIQK